MSSKCGECGFLTMRDRRTRQLAEVELELRRTGEMPKLTSAHDQYGLETAYESVYESNLICLRHAYDLHQEYIDGEGNYVERFKNVLTRERECEHFTKWHQGFTPQDHAQMIRDIEAARAQLARENSMKDFQAEQAELNRAQQRTSQLISLVAVGVAVLGSITGPILGAYANSRMAKPPQPINVVMPDGVSFSMKTAPTHANQP